MKWVLTVSAQLWKRADEAWRVRDPRDRSAALAWRYMFECVNRRREKLKGLLVRSSIYTKDQTRTRTRAVASWIRVQCTYVIQRRSVWSWKTHNNVSRKGKGDCTVFWNAGSFYTFSDYFLKLMFKNVWLNLLSSEPEGGILYFNVESLILIKLLSMVWCHVCVDIRFKRYCFKISL